MAKVREQLGNPQTLLILGMVGFLLTYALATRAIDTGSLGQYGLTFLLLGVSINVIVRAVRAYRNAGKR